MLRTFVIVSHTMLPPRATFVATGLCLLTMLAAGVFGQSGRRGAKSPSVPVPATEEKPAEKKPAADLTKVPLLVGATRKDVFTGVPFSIYDAVVQSCAHRLDDSSAVKVEPVANGLSRAEAVERAKAAKEGYVVWLHLRGDDLSAAYGTDLEAIFIEYFVFEHTTAKVRTSGNCYQGAYRRGPVVVGPNTRSRTSTMVIESRLRQAAEEAAERILKALHFSSAEEIPPH
jgi:hypothetical protein